MREKTCNSQSVSQAGRGHSNGATIFRKNFALRAQQEISESWDHNACRKVCLRQRGVADCKRRKTHSGTRSDARLRTCNIIQTP
jgi:hypothetical protein